ncbi:hypothetical protein GCM10023217_33780 [Gordonia alkaliphila]|uniref:Macro domain-containing protein n=2 Tax=Gordonia TaxID=2053 RepID=A0ABP8ZKM2_9ACTN
MHNHAMTEIEIVRGDITAIATDAVVNAANSRMRGGGGVDGAIHRVGGPLVLEDCIRRFPDGLPAGQAGYTAAGNLPVDWVIHAVGPNFAAGQRNRVLLESCYRNSLAVADELGVESVAFPLISAGAYGWPMEDAIAVAIDTIAATDTRVESVAVVTPDQRLAKRLRYYLGTSVPIRLLEGIEDLHRRGYENVRALPSISPSGFHWRLQIEVGMTRDQPDVRFEVPTSPTIVYSNSDVEQFARGVVTAATPLRAVGDLILAELKLTEKSSDPRYAAWFRQLVELSRSGDQLPWAFDDYGWRRGGWFGNDRLPAPPPVDAGSARSE